LKQHSEVGGLFQVHREAGNAEPRCAFPEVAALLPTCSELRDDERILERLTLHVGSASGRVGTTRLHHAAYRGDSARARTLLAAGYIVDAVEGVETWRPRGVTSLAYAIMRGERDIARLLYAAGADAPLALAPILGDSLAAHWIEHVASLGANQVRVIAADRADDVRAALGDGARWGVQLEVISAHLEPTLAEAAARFRPVASPDWLSAPHSIVLMNHLPGTPELPLFESNASWFAALMGWLPRALTPSRVRVSELNPGIWVGRRAHVSPRAVLIGPCWIGDQVIVEPGAIVGPGAILEDRSVVEEDARMQLQVDAARDAGRSLASGGPAMSLRQRSLPFIRMLERCQAENK
jgi:hypothetical protein